MFVLQGGNEEKDAEANCDPTINGVTTGDKENVENSAANGTEVKENQGKNKLIHFTVNTTDKPQPDFEFFSSFLRPLHI
jgi:hypothetical protein